MSQIFITITAKDDTQKAINSATKRAEKFETAIERLNKRFSQFSAGAVAAVALSTKIFSDFEKGVTEVSTLLGDVSNTAINQLSEQLKTVAVNSGQALDQLTKANYDIVSSGFRDAGAAALVMDSAVKLAVGGVAEVGDTAKLVSGLLNAFGESADKAAGFTDDLFQIVNKGVTTIPELALQLGDVSGIARTAGLGLKDVGAIMATLTSSNLSTAKATTALRGAIVQLFAPSTSAAKLMNDLNISIQKTAAGNVDLVKTFEQFKGLDLNTIRGLIPDIEGANAVSVLASNIDTLRGNVADFADTSGLAESAYTKMTETLSFQFDQIKQRLTVAALEIAEALLPIIERVTDIITAFSDLSKSTIQTFTKIGAAVTAAGGVIKTLSVGLRLFGAALGPVGAVAAGLLTATTAYASLSSATEAHTNIMRTQETEFIGLANRLIDLNKTTETLSKTGETSAAVMNERKGVIELINTKYGEYLGNLDTENASLTDLQTAVSRVNEQYKERIAIASAENILKERIEALTIERQKADELRIELGLLTTAISKINNLELSLKSSAEFGAPAEIIEGQKRTALAALDEIGRKGQLTTGASVAVIQTALKQSADLLQHEKGLLQTRVLENDKNIATMTKAHENFYNHLKALASGSIPESAPVISSALPDTGGAVQKIRFAVDLPILETRNGLDEITTITEDYAQTAMEKTRAASEFLAELTGNDTDLTIQALTDRFNELSKYSSNRVALETALNETLTGLREDARTNDLAEEAAYLHEKLSQVQQFTSLASSAIQKYENFKVTANSRSVADQIKEQDAFFKAEQKRIKTEFTIEGKLTEQGKTAIERITERHEIRTNQIREEGQKRERDILAAFKPVKLASAITNVAVGVTKALSMGPPGIPLAIALGAAGAVEVGIIASQPYETGGIVGSEKQLTAGERIFSFEPQGRDTIPAILQVGEAVIPAAVVRANRPLIDDLINGNFTALSQIATDRSIPETFAGSFGDTINSTNISQSFQNGGIISSPGSFAQQPAQQTATNTQPVIIERQPVDITINLSVSALDPEKASEAIEKLVQSNEFLDPLKEVINNRNINIEIDGKRASAG